VGAEGGPLAGMGTDMGDIDGDGPPRYHRYEPGQGNPQPSSATWERIVCERDFSKVVWGKPRCPSWFRRRFCRLRQ
jgi:hypothetical protein